MLLPASFHACRELSLPWVMKQPSSVGEVGTQHTKASISMLTSVILDFMIQPDSYSATVQAPLNREM